MSIMNVCKHFTMISVLLHIRPASESRPDPRQCSNVEYNKHDVQVIMADMRRTWPNLQNVDNTLLWTNEWKMHGTCSPLKAMEYFTKTINLAKKHDVKSYLQKSNIVPGKIYNSRDIKKAIQDSIKFVPVLRTGQQNRLKEIFICYTKEFALRNCIQQDSNVGMSVEYPSIHNQQLIAAFHQEDNDTPDVAPIDSTHFRLLFPIVLVLVFLVYCFNNKWKRRNIRR
ncbi:ribonuclease Phyb-like isoform X2 [Crassostrea virginica]